MGEDSEPLTTGNGSADTFQHRRILIKMAGVIVVGAVGALIFFSAAAAAGVLIGGVLAFANYLWQKHSLKVIFDLAVHGHKARFLALRYILRYVALGAVLSLVYFSQTVPIYAVIFGLASFAAAVMIEGVGSIFTTSRDES